MAEINIRNCRRILLILLMSILIATVLPVLGSAGKVNAADTSVTLTTNTVTCSKIKGYFTIDFGTDTIVGMPISSAPYTYSVDVYPVSGGIANKLTLASDPTLTETSSGVFRVSFETASSGNTFEDGEYAIKLNMGVKMFSITTNVASKTEYRTIAHGWTLNRARAASCVIEGFKEYYCSSCGSYKTEMIPALGGHIWGEETVTEEPTCTSEGLKFHRCTRCGDSEEVAIPKAAHSWDSGRVTRTPKYLTAGVRTHTCTECGASKSVSIPKLNASAVTPAKAKITSAKAAKKKVTIQWKRIAKNTKGYQIAIKNKKTNVITYYNASASKKSKISKKIKLKKGTYAVMLRAYNVVNGETIYGPWSNVKGGKVK